MSSCSNRSLEETHVRGLTLYWHCAHLKLLCKSFNAYYQASIRYYQDRNSVRISRNSWTQQPSNGRAAPILGCFEHFSCVWRATALKRIQKPMLIFCRHQDTIKTDILWKFYEILLQSSQIMAVRQLLRQKRGRFGAKWRNLFLSIYLKYNVVASLVEASTESCHGCNTVFD